MKKKFSWIFLSLLALSLFLPYFTFGEDVKVVEENGLTLVMLLSIVLALWTASVSLADEIEGRTALTVLCKPISRRDFVLGKFLGILGPVAILFIILVPLILYEVWRVKGKGIGARVMEQGSVIP